MASLSPAGAQVTDKGAPPAPGSAPEAPGKSPDAGRAPDAGPAPDGTAPQAPRPIAPLARPDGARPLERLPETAAEKRKALADLYAQLATAEDEAAATRYARAIERIWRLSGSDTVNLLIGRATKAAAAKRVDLAAKLLDHAVSLAPDYAEAFNQRAFLHFKQNNYHAAVGDLRRVLALDPNHYKAMEGLAQIWRETGNKKGAYGVMKQLIEVHPFAPGAEKVYQELKREVEGRGI